MASNGKSWLKDNIVGIIIATLLSIMGYGGNEAIQYFKYKMQSMEQWRIEDIVNDAAIKNQLKAQEQHLNDIDGNIVELTETVENVNERVGKIEQSQIR